MNPDDKLLKQDTPDYPSLEGNSDRSPYQKIDSHQQLNLGPQGNKNLPNDQNGSSGKEGYDQYYKIQNQPQNVQHNYQPVNYNPQSNNGYQGYQPPQMNSYQNQYPPSQNNQNYGHRPQVIIGPQQNLVARKGPTHQVPITTNRYNAILDAQNYPCQHCGHRGGINPVKYVPGSAACAWGCALFWLTGIFCWVPCVMNSCKDTQIICQNCHQKKAIVPANCCCQ